MKTIVIAITVQIDTATFKDAHGKCNNITRIGHFTMKTDCILSMHIIVYRMILFSNFITVNCQARAEYRTQKKDQGVPGSSPSRCTFRYGLEQVTFTLLSTG